MAMELDIIKTDTTWNDAAASLNNNFGKVKQAIAMGGGSGSGGGISQENADKRYIRKVVDNFDKDLTFAIADGIVGTDDEYYFIPAKAPSTARDSQILATKADVNQGGGSIDPALLEGYMPLMREFSDDFNNDFAR